LEGKCDMPEHVWNDVKSVHEVEWAKAQAKERGETNMSKYLSGWSDDAVIDKIKETLKPPRVEDYEIQFEGKKLKHSGPPSELGSKFETWAADWLALEREAKSQGVEIAPARMKKHFEQAVRWHPAIERIIKGTVFTSCKEWYGKISRELQVQASYAAQMERDLKGGRGNSTPFQSSQGGRGRGHLGGSMTQPESHQSPQRRKFQERRQDAHPGSQSPGTGNAGRGAGGGAARSNHMDGKSDKWAQGNKMESMTWSPSQAGGRGRGGRGRARSEPPSPGRGDRKGILESERQGTRMPINDVRHESEQALPKGPYWHETGDLLKCRSATCGQPFDTTVFCQGCGWEGHSRPWCYKSNEPGFNKTGYYSINRAGKGPLPGRNGNFRGNNGARFNMADADQDHSNDTRGSGLA
jgi:hypothetical protein